MTTIYPRAASPTLVPRRDSLSDPFSAALRPPADETPAERERRIAEELRAKQVSDAIDEQLKLERAEQKRNKADVKVLLLGQSESGKSTTLKQFQLTHTPKAFHAERMAWRSVIYLNLVRSIRRILEAVSPDPDEPLVVPATSLPSTSFGQPGPSSSAVLHDPDKYTLYAQRLAPLVLLEERLIRMLSEDVDDDEATRLEDGSAPGWLTNGNASIGSSNSGNGALSTASSPSTAAGARPAIHIDTRSLPGSPSTRSPVARGVEVAVRTPKWKQALSLSRKQLKSTSPHSGTGEVVGWWEDPNDPVHVLFKCSRPMRALWADPWVQAKLTERRIRLEESSGFYLNEIDRITAMKYIPTDDDILKARLKTVGVQEHSFTLTQGASRPMIWKIYDVGGARNQRQAWAPYFTDVNAIIFLAPISAFDQVLAEDPRVNRLEDSLLLWRSVVSNKLLKHVNLIIFLNKCDLLKTKLESGVKLNQFLLTYGDRSNEYEAVSKYLRNKFGLLHQQHTPNPNRELFIHFTAVTDTRRTGTIIANVRDIIVRRNLKDSKLLV
ncbi:G-alpha-domain-containing protein [Vararia minispora EC-137]|uniref:G-alpha-domain-containing protein n=1 Tax=Vararia minispora EC-137 TaxID=1314806 RepID=A0ACB8QCD0_9AGAM|nr:G-alpha-domain-containing protein [Vararia minispora EC-137]